MVTGPRAVTRHVCALLRWHSELKFSSEQTTSSTEHACPRQHALLALSNHLWSVEIDISCVLLQLLPGRDLLCQLHDSLLALDSSFQAELHVVGRPELPFTADPKCESN